MMGCDKFEAVMIVLVPQVVQLIVKNQRMQEVEASERFYKSELYSLLEQEETKLWHLSALALYELYNEEITTGTITFPEEA